MTFSSNVKAQAAMEFLMTYGWAILVVLVVIGALAYFGVLSPSTLLPEKCTFPVSLSCTDHRVTASGVTIILQNGAGRDMTINRVSANSEALGTGIRDCGCIFGGLPVTVRNGASATFILDSNDNTPGAVCSATACGFSDTGRDKNRYNITLNYNWLDSPGVTHQLSGELLAKKP